MTPLERVQMVDNLLNEHTDEQVAAILNDRDLHPGKGGAFRGRLVGNIRLRLWVEEPLRPIAGGWYAHRSGNGLSSCC